MRYRRNADEAQRRGARRLAREGDEAALTALIQEAVRSGNLLSLPAGAFIHALSRDPFLLRALPQEALEHLQAAMDVNHVTRPEDWFPQHQDQGVCPRGHVINQQDPDNPNHHFGIRFALIESGTPIYRTVETAGADMITVELGDWDSGDPTTLLLDCDACGATWPQRGDLDYT